MPFNHYAKIKRILDDQPAGWYVKRINSPTSAKTFSGDLRLFDHYYRVYDHDGKEIKYCKFQQLDRLASIMKIPVQELPFIE